MININFRDARPIYEQVKDGFRQLILSGVLPADAKMPSVRELAGQLAINPNASSVSASRCAASALPTAAWSPTASARSRRPIIRSAGALRSSRAFTR